MSNSLRLQQARCSCPSLSTGVCSNSRPLSQSCHPTISSSASPFSSCPQHSQHQLCLVTQWCPALCNPMDCNKPGSSAHGDSPGKNTGVGCHALLQGIFPTQGLNPRLPHCGRILYCLSHIRVFSNELALHIS